MHQLRLVLLALAALMGVALALGPSLLDWRRPGARHAEIPVIEAPAAVARIEPSVQRSVLEAALEGALPYRRFFDRLHLAFPADYERAETAAARQDARSFNVDAALSEAARGLRQARGILAAKASGPLLSRVFEMQLAVMRALATRDRRLCVDFLYGGASEGLTAFSADNRALIADLALAGLEAIHDGQSARVERGPPSDEDFAMLETALTAKGLEKAEIEALLDGRTPEPALDDARMCRSGQVYLETLRELPEDIRLRIYALAVELMARG